MFYEIHVQYKIVWQIFLIEFQYNTIEGEIYVTTFSYSLERI